MQATQENEGLRRSFSSAWNNAADLTWSLIEINGTMYACTDLRVDRASVPQGLYVYDVRQGEEGDPCEIAPWVMVDHMMTILSREPVQMEEGYDAQFLDDDVSWGYACGETLSLEQLLQTRDWESLQ